MKYFLGKFYPESFTDIVIMITSIVIAITVIGILRLIFNWIFLK